MEGDYTSLIEGAIKQSRLNKNIFSSLKLLITLDGKQEFEEVLLASSSKTQSIIRYLSQSVDPPEKIELYCFVRKNKVEISNNKLLEESNCKFAFSFEFSLKEFNKICDEEQEKFISEYKKCFELLNALDNSELKKRLDKIEYYLSHMAPITYYIREVCYSTFDYLNNMNKKSKTVSRQSLLKFWKDYPLEKWENEDYIFVCFVNYLLDSGLQTRLEEFNGKQVSLGQLDNYLVHKHGQYQKIIGSESILDLKSLSMEQKVEIIKSEWEKVSKKGVIYRQINGLSLQKSEEYILNEILLEDFIFDQSLSKDIFETFNIKSENEVVFKSQLNEYFKSDFPHMKERFFDLLNFVLLKLSNNTHSDISFSRFFSNIGLLEKLDLKNNLQEIVDLNARNYYCLVTPSEEMLKKAPISLVSNIGMAVNSRMLYNGWHYMPGNFIKGFDVNLKERDYYFSAVLPDLTNKDKYHHAGHVKLEINNCIRVPLNITINKREYKALMDVRLFRRGNQEYTVNELSKGIIYSKYIRKIGQSLYDAVALKEDFEFSLGQMTRDEYTKRLEKTINRGY